MKAMICEAANAPLVLEDVTLGDLGPRDVRVRVLASGVCHTDLSVAGGWAGEAAAFPVLLGHEAVGEVVKIGSDVSRCKPGDKVIASIMPTCGECWHCVRDEAQLCELFMQVAGSYWVQRANGAAPALAMAGLGTFAEEMITHEASVVPVTTELPDEVLAMIGCGVTTGVGAALWTAKVAPGSTVAVFGCGGVGQAVIQGARVAGAARIIAVDPQPFKREMAKQLGATDAVDPGEGDVVEAILALTGGRGVDYGFEVTGMSDVTFHVFRAIRRGGMAVQVGMTKADATVSIPTAMLMADERKLVGSMYGSAQVRRHFNELISLAEAGRLDLNAMVSRRIGLADVNEAFEAMRSGEVIRSVIVH